MVEVFQDKDCNLFKDVVIHYNEDSYIVAIDGKIIGHFNVLIINDTYSIEYELLKEFRGIGLGGKFLSIIENFVQDKFNVDEILLMIKYDNLKSIKLAKKNNYSIDYSLYEEIIKEDSSYVPYTKRIEKNKNLIKQ